MKVLYIFAMLLLILCRCQTKPDDPTPEEPYETADSIIVPPPPDQVPEPFIEEEQLELKASEPNNDEEPPVVSTVKFSVPSLIPKKVIRHAYLRIQVKNYAASTKALKNYISRQKAFIANSEEERTSGTLQNSLQIRVADENFDLLLADLLQESVYLEHKTITAKDVTEESVEIDARLNSRKKVEERYLALLARAKNVKEILAIETELKTIQEEIEAAAAKQQYLQSQVAFSTITLDYFQTTSPIQPPDNSLTKRIAQALVAGWESMLSFSLLLLGFWPLGILVAILVSIYFKWKKTSLGVANSPNV